jgi:hypothetical protein
LWELPKDCRSTRRHRNEPLICQREARLVMGLGEPVFEPRGLVGFLVAVFDDNGREVGAHGMRPRRVQSKFG